MLIATEENYFGEAVSESRVVFFLSGEIGVFLPHISKKCMVELVKLGSTSLSSFGVYIR